MGYMQATEMAELADTRSGMTWHLRSNHFPPVPMSMVDVCLEAIDRANAGDWTSEVALPADVRYRDGSDRAPVSAIIRGYHLAPWLEEE